MLLEIMIVSQGDLDKLRDGVVFLTVHDVGASYEVESLLKILKSYFYEMAWLNFDTACVYKEHQQKNKQQICIL